MRIIAILLMTASLFTVGCAHYGKGNKMANKFKMMDKDGDGAISEKEFESSKEDNWKAMDANTDGKVTLAEMKAFKKSKKKKKSCGCGDS